MSSRSAFQPLPDASVLRLSPHPAPLRWIARWWRRGRAVDELKGLPESQLRDIGIERCDVEALIDRELTRFKAR